jgi:flagellar biosynthetic protein FliP
LKLARLLAPAAFIAFLLISPAQAADVAAAAPAAVPTGSAIPGALDRAFGQIAGAQSGGSLSLSLQLLLIMGLLTILPSLVLMMTSFTRILVVLAILRQALGLRASPEFEAWLQHMGVFEGGEGSRLADALPAPFAGVLARLEAA